MKIKLDYNSIDLIISERFAVLEAYFFNTYFYAGRFEDLVEYLDYYVFDNFYEEREEFIIKSDIISVDFDDYLAFTCNLIDIIELSFETIHVMLQQSSTGNSAICF